MNLWHTLTASQSLEVNTEHYTYTQQSSAGKPNKSLHSKSGKKRQRPNSTHPTAMDSPKPLKAKSPKSNDSTRTGKSKRRRNRKDTTGKVSSHDCHDDREDKNVQRLEQDSNVQRFEQDPNIQVLEQDSNVQGFEQDPNVQGFEQDPRTSSGMGVLEVGGNKSQISNGNIVRKLSRAEERRAEIELKRAEKRKLEILKQQELEEKSRLEVIKKCSCPFVYE